MKVKCNWKKLPKPILDYSPLDKAIEQNAEEMKENTIALAPEKTGLLKDSIETKDIENGKAVYLEAEKAYYGFFQEFGWHAGKTFTPGKFFFETAFEVQKFQMEQDIDSITDTIVQIGTTNGKPLRKIRNK